MASSSDDTVLTVALVGIGAYLLYLKFKSLCPPGAASMYDCICPGQTSLWGCLTNLNFGGGGAPGLLPGGAGGTPGAGAAGGGGPGGGGTTTTPGTGGPGAVVNTATTPPSGAGPGGGVPMCVDANYNVVGAPDANGNCPPGTVYTIMVNVTQ